MKVLVTGGRGFLGRYVTDELDRRGHEFYAPSHDEMNVLSRPSIQLELSSYRPDAIIHAAAAVGGIGANVAEPGRFFRDNVVMGINLLEAVRVYDPPPKILTIGTACMYPADLALLSEDKLWDGKPAAATAPYGYAKRAVLEMGQAYRDQYGVNATMVIPTNLYGPHDNFDLDTGHVIPAMVRRFVEADGDAWLWGTGHATRDFLYVSDAASGIVRALEHYDEPEPVNLGTGVDHSIREVAERIATLTGFEGAIRWDPSKPDGTPRRRLSTFRAAEKFGWIANTKLDKGLKETVEWYLAQQEVHT